MKDKIIYFWLAGFYVKKNLVCPPPSCSDTALSTVCGALARSQDAVCIAPAAAAATAAGCWLVVALLLLPPPGSGGDGCCIRSCLAPLRHLACQSRGVGGQGSAGEGWRARDLQRSGLVERRGARIRPRRAPAPAPARQGPAEGGGGGARRLAHLAGKRDDSRRLQGERGAGFLGDAELAWQSEITTGRACERAVGGRGRGGSAHGGPRLLPGAVEMAGTVLQRGGWAEGAGRGIWWPGGGGGHYYGTALARRGRSAAQQVHSRREQVCVQL